MKMKKLFIAALMVLFSTKVFAEEYSFDPFFDDNFSIKDQKVVVGIYDEATGGCWTNLGEVKRYAEDKLMLKGADVVNDMDDANLVLNILVKTIDIKEFPNNCIGKVEINLQKGVRSKGFKWMATMADSGVLFVDQKPINITLLEKINDHLASYK
ncbi:hypothetical protein N9854_07040 [Amylibacter sp.]|jgi:hypothetical protein|nr:hypothetical protein [Amylibacter sp.]